MRLNRRVHRKFIRNEWVDIRIPKTYHNTKAELDYYYDEYE